MSGLTGWTPRPAQPYEPGNTASLRHGAYSRRTINDRAEMVRAELLDQAPWVRDPLYATALDLAAEAVARAQLADDACRQRPGARNLEAATSAARLAWAKLTELGLTPAGHARLKLLVAGEQQAEQAMAEVMAAGSAIVEAREAGR
ncbi:MAG TPA: hypothetical protein VG435_04665 [Acidimicrobiales bacterium]|jgi:hypothetical protein|nr:hypothetical protein [Acidimicrobiales bacterium]